MQARQPLQTMALLSARALAAVLAAVLAGALHRHLSIKYRPGSADPQLRRARLPATDEVCVPGISPATAAQPDLLLWSEAQLVLNGGELHCPQDETGAHVHGVTNDQGVELYVRHWPAAGSVPFRGCVFMVHGYTWHSKYFDKTAAYLNAKGFTVTAHDLPAHGLSGSLFGIQGYHAPLESFVHGVKAVIDDALQRHLCGPQHSSKDKDGRDGGSSRGSNGDGRSNGRDDSSSRGGSGNQDGSNGSSGGGSGSSSSTKPALFLYGESFGAVVVLHTLLRHSDLAAQLSGVITGGVPLKPPEVLPPAAAVAVVQQIGRLYPLLPMPKGDAFEPEGYVQAFGDEGLAKGALKDDPLIVRQSQFGMMNVMLPAVLALKPRLLNITRPLLILHGLSDSTVGPASSLLLHEKAGTLDKELRLYKGARHQLMQEAAGVQERVWEDMASWLLQHSSGGAAAAPA